MGANPGIGVDAMAALSTAAGNRMPKPSLLRHGSTAVRLLVRSRPALVSSVFIILLLATVLVGPVIIAHDPITTSLGSRLHPVAWLPGGTLSSPLGTDQLGRDVLTRTIYGARMSLLIAVVATTIAVVLGVGIGLISGIHGGLTDVLIMRLVDGMLSLPLLLLAIVVFAIIGPGSVKLTLFLGVWGAPEFVRVTRAQVLKVKETEFVTAARAFGIGGFRLTFRYILINSLAPLITLATLFLPFVIITEGALGFIGMGVQDPTPSWGNMIADGRDRLGSAWWIAVAPATAMALTVLAFNLLGDWVRDVTDPKTRGAQI